MTVDELSKFLAPVTKKHEEYAKILSERYASFGEIAEAEQYDLAELIGNDVKTSIYIKLAVALASRRVTDSFKFGKRHTEEEIIEDLVAKSFGLSVETIHIITENEDGVQTSCNKLSEGTINYSDILPRKIIETAKRYGSKRVILSHNHPGGYPEPSQSDISSTKLLAEILKTSGITLLAHYVIAADKCKKIDI